MNERPLRHAITAKYVRLYPYSWGAGGIGLKFDIMGCYNGEHEQILHSHVFC